MPAFKSHHTDTVDKPWDAGANEKKVKSGEKRPYYAKIYGWYEPEGTEGAKSTYKFPHHEVGADGTPGPANTNGCSAAIGALNGGRGGADIPDADRSGVHAHMATHLKDAKKEIPPLKSQGGAEDYPLMFASLQDQIWAIRPGKLEEITAVVEKYLAGERPDFLEAAKARGGNGVDEPGYTMHGSVARIPVIGTLGKRMNLFSNMSGGESYDRVGQRLQAALADPNVEAVLLDIDSPGGPVDGVQTLADKVLVARDKKPVVAYTDGDMASAAYWVGSAASKVMASPTAMVGSIGVAGTHFDRSAQDAIVGVKRTVISSGKYKRVASDAEPLSPEGKDYLQQMSDTYYQLFLQSVGKNRGLPAGVVHAQMADGRDFVGRQALDAGLVDQIGSMEEALAMAQQMGKEKVMSSLNKKVLEEEHPEIYAEVKAEGKAEGIEAGKAQERTVLLGMLAANAPADQREAILRGSFEAALDSCFASEAKLKETILAKMAAEATRSMGGTQGQEGMEGTFESKVAEARKANPKLGKGAAILQVSREFPELHKAYLETLKSPK